MPWFFYSFLSAVSFAGMILVVRKLLSSGFSAKVVLLFLTGFTSLGFLFMNVLSPGAILRSENFGAFLLFMTIAGVSVIIGNWTDFEAIKAAPNPGYAVAIRNATILPVALVAPFLFSSALHPLALLAAAGMVVGTAILAWEKKENGQSRIGIPWYLLALIALVGFTFTVLAQKRTLLLGDVTPQEINLLMSLFNCVAFSLLGSKEAVGILGDTPRLRVFLPLVILAALFSFGGNIFSVLGLDAAPNPGYHETIKNSNTLFVALLAIPLFGAEKNMRKLTGVMIILASIAALLLGS